MERTRNQNIDITPKQKFDRHKFLVGCFCCLIFIRKLFKKQIIDTVEVLVNQGKCSKILNTFLFLFSNKTLVFRAGFTKTCYNNKQGST